MYRILLIDDNSFFNATFAGLLQRAGYQVTVASNYQEGRPLYEEDPADLVIMSIYLKGDEGAGCLEALQDTFSAARFIGLLCESEKNERYYPLVFKALKNRRIFHKPFRTEEVLDAIYQELAPPAREACW